MLETPTPLTCANVNTHLEKNQTRQTVIEAAALPVKGGAQHPPSLVLVRGLQLAANAPEVLRDEGQDLQVSLHHEAEGGELARTVADHIVFKSIELALQPQGLEASEGGSQAQVDLLPGIHGIAHVLVGALGVLHCSENVSRNQSRELGSVDVHALVVSGGDVDHLISDVLSLQVTVQPQKEHRATTTLLFQCSLDALFVLRNCLLNLILISFIVFEKKQDG